MKNRHQIVFGCITVLICLTPLIVNAQPGHSIRNNKSHSTVFEGLDLTDEQKTKLTEMYKESKTLMKEHFQKVRDLRKQIREELLKEDPSKTTLAELARVSGELERVHTETRNEHILKVKKILSTEQFTALLDRDKHMHLGDNKENKRNMHNRRNAGGKKLCE